jgi:hypothetical protein
MTEMSGKLIKSQERRAPDLLITIKDPRTPLPK